MHFCNESKNKINLLRYQKFKNALGDLKNFGLDIIHLHKNKRNQILHYVLFCLHLTSFFRLNFEVLP